MLEDAQNTYFFPRVPLKFVLPENYPDLGTVTNISVIPEITDYRFTRAELELKGSYQITVTYVKSSLPPVGETAERTELKYDEFFSPLKLQSDGYFTEVEDELDASNESSGREVYTVTFSRHFHTFVDNESIGRPRSFRPFMVVERINLEPEGQRLLKGELALQLINRNRRKLL